ncbi:hypothetical protein ACJRO7_007184 [Eucalyptus globulus]|uniref:Uncharacterized protein n=1 Tax=Eucalyptus globulus TaxID=34317 RepID=A0ABD3IMS9_EUCGL
MKKVVIKMSMNGQNSRMCCFGPQSSQSKAFRVVGSLPGVQSMAVLGEDDNMIEVTGDRFDAVKLTILLRKNVGFAEIVTVSEIDEKESERENKPVIWSYINGVPHREFAHVMDPYPYYSEPSCSIM